MGKDRADKELNCGSCGYPSCKDKAVAIAQGMAELEMCLPYMREKAENMANLVIDFTPNAVLVVDPSLIIRVFNPAAEVMFQVKAEEVKGKPLSAIMDEVHFLQAFDGKGTFRVKERCDHLGLVTLQTLTYIHEEDLVLGIIMDITGIEKQQQVLETMKRETIDRAQEVIEKQMRVAQEIAGLLGETTAESKVLLTKLIRLVKEGGSDHVIP
jgi:nitrogen-specific signal transduction histidine kinase